MSLPSSRERPIPNRRQAIVFQAKALVLKMRRAAADILDPVPRHSRAEPRRDAGVLSEVTAELWNHGSAVEFPLTAGKVENLRIACRALHGLEVPAGATLSFWKQVGRTTRAKGYTTGRELREGCLVANRGGGLCQLSNLLYSAALDAGFEIVERHAHSRVLPGSLAARDRDATVFWNYVDLRFRSPAAPFRLETELTATRLVVRICAQLASAEPARSEAQPPDGLESAPVRSAPTGDCLTCGVSACFRHPSANRTDGRSGEHAAFLLDEYWPEFQEWCGKHSHAGDRWYLPLDGHRWGKPNYAWSPPGDVQVRRATGRTLVTAFRNRRLPPQGAARQRALLARDAALARHFARHLDPTARHLVVSQNLLPHLQEAGVLGGRTYDVLMTRWPLAELQRRLDLAADDHPSSTTARDFRADPHVLQLEAEALTNAGRVITPHRAIAQHFGDRALLLDWHLPSREPGKHVTTPRQVFFPASLLARKGAYELAASLRGLDAELVILGAAREDGVDPLAAVPHRRGSTRDLLSSAALVLPAWIEHQPRLALRALANDIPVVATAACGLPEHPLLFQLEEPSSQELHARLAKLLSPGPLPVVASEA